MASIRFLWYLSLLLLIIGCVLGSRKLTIQVSDHGSVHDEPQCGLREPHTCKTLAYVLNQMKTSYDSGLISQLVINVMYNQTITQKTLEITLHFRYIYSVSVVGFNNAFINFEKAGSSIQISQLIYDHSISWSWIGLGFAWVGQFTVKYIPQISMYAIAEVLVLNCTFISVSFSGKMLSFIIKNNVFGNSAICPCVSLTEVYYLAIAENNTFENCQLVHHNFLLHIQMHNRAVKIVKNSFLNLKAERLFNTSAISIIGVPLSILIQNNQFIGNAVSLIAIDTTVDYKALIGSSCTWCIIKKNSFLNNHFPPTALEPILVEISAEIITSICPMELSFYQNIFENNTHVHLLSMKVGTENNVYNTSTVNITGLTLLNNVGTSWLVMIEHNGLLYQNILINLAFLRIENNIVWYKYENDIAQSLIVLVKNVNQSIIRDSTFRTNLGTPLVFKNDNLYGTHLVLCVIGDLQFQQNNAIYGGAMSLYNVRINTSCQSTITFKDNFGRYGGALYVDNILKSGLGVCNTTLEFIANRAAISGDAIYVQSYSSDLEMILRECSRYLSKTEVASAAANIVVLNLKDNNYLSIFPGQNILLNISITDYYGMPSLCTADIAIFCNGTIYKCRYNLFIKNIKLYGPDTVVLVQQSSTGSSIIDTNLRIQSPINTNFQNISLHLSCKNSNANITFLLNIRSCPQGFIYDSMLNACKCAVETKHTLCSTVLGAVCVSRGYWYGQVHNEYTVARCKYSACKIRNKPCPLGMQSGNKYFLLSGTQCSSGRGGILCRTCAEHFVFSFLSIECISEEICSLSKAIALIFSAILFQILITVFLVFLVRFKHHLGCGFLYGPMLFLAVVNHIPLDDYSEYSTLSRIVSIITSVALLNLELFGRIPWCFFESIPKLYNYSLRMLGPLTVLVVLLGITALSRWHPKCSLFEKIRMRVRPQRARHTSNFRVNISPLKAMCILMMLSFWSLADISINILTPTVLETQHYSMYMVSIQPDITFFSPQHLPLAIPALLVLLVVILPLVIILLSAPFLQRVINLVKIKPFLDEFQSCYKDKYRWYSGVYFVVWIAIVGIQGLPDSLLYTQTIFFILLCIQILFKPYRGKLLNITDTLLLVDLNFLIALLYNKMSITTSSYTILPVLIHALIIVPFVCALLWVTYSLYNSVKGVLCRKQRDHELQQPQDVEQISRPQVPVQEVRFPDFSTNNEREPLIAIVQNQ